MKHSLIILGLFWLLFACNHTDANKAFNATADVVQQGNTKANIQRQQLIEELNKLRLILSSQNKEKIADIFQFPLPDTAIEIYINDNNFNSQYQKNGNKLTKAMFIDFFSEISEAMQINEVNELFTKIQLDSLHQKDFLEYETNIETEPCYHFYNIEIANNTIQLTVGTHSNRDYKSTVLSENEILENSSEICEHIMWWIFEFNGGKLHFKRIFGAG